MATLSRRCQKNLAEIIAKVPKHLLHGPSNVDAIDLSFAENHLIRLEVFDLVSEELKFGLSPEHLDWPKGLWGDPQLLSLLSQMFNSYFHPREQLGPQDFVVGPGAAACLDALVYNICDDGDGVLIPCPYWNGYDNFVRSHSGVTLIPVTVSDLRQSLELNIVEDLERTLLAQTKGMVKALIISNPHNPLGRCYSSETLLGIAEFCFKYKIHLVSDEVFALSVFHSEDLPDATKFTSVLALDSEAVRRNQEYVHVVWSVSKDLALSGSRLGTIVTKNRTLRNAAALMGPANVSTISTISCRKILAAGNLRILTELNKTRLSNAYKLITNTFKEYSIEYFPTNCATFILAKLVPKAGTEEEEIMAMLQYSTAGVVLSSGQAYHMPAEHHGWLRVCFAVDQEILKQALDTIVKVYQTLNR